MNPPRHLWSGDWRADSERAREAAEEEARRHAAAAAPPPPAPPPERRSRRSGRLAAAAVAIGLVATAFTGGVLLDSDGGSDPLPAVADSPIKPRKNQSQAGAVYASASPAVVSVRTGGGSGTGFLIEGDGKIVTNAHVVGSSKRVTVRFGEGESVAADVLGTDPSSDLAVLSIESRDVPNGVKPLQFADSRGVQVGDTAIAIGNPFGLDRTATEGIVSGIGREIEAPNGFSIDQVIQTDAPINPGNSGGPLLDDSGRVIGVNSQIATAGSQGNVGIGFAVPSNTARLVVPQLERGEKVERAYLGVESGAANPSGDGGAEIASVIPDGPADRAGLRPGDVIVRVAGKDVENPSDVAAAISDRRPGDKVEVEVRRGGATVKVDATLGTRPARTP